MFRLLLLFLMIPTLTFAQPVVQVISRYDAHVNGGIVASEYIRILNKIQDEYEFRLSIVPGAAGESADQKAVAIARQGQDVLVIGALSTWGLNGYTFPGTLDRDNDIVPLIAVEGFPNAILVDEKSPINTVEELLAKIRTKETVYHATTAGAGMGTFHAQLFVEKFGINNAKMITYRSSTDLIRGLIGGELDYAIYIASDIPGLKALATSASVRLPLYPNAKIGSEIGFPEFTHSSLTTFGVPKERKEFGQRILHYLSKVCESDEIKALIERTRAPRYYCYNSNELKARIANERVLFNKYQNIIQTNFGPRVQTTKDLRTP